MPPPATLSAHRLTSHVQIIEDSEGKDPTENEESDYDDDDIEAQIQRELSGLQPTREKNKKRPVEVTRLDMPCGAFSHITITPCCRATHSTGMHGSVADAYADVDTQQFSLFVSKSRLTP